MTSLINICAIIFIFKIPEPGECVVRQAVFHTKRQRYLMNHIIATKQADSELDCSMYCVADASCVSVNFKTSGIGKGRCELNNKTLTEISNADGYTQNVEFNHLYIIFKKLPEPRVPSNPPSTYQQPEHSCKELLEKNGSLGNGVYQLKYRNSHGEYRVYCHMSEIDGCEGKGWTLAMKIDGTKQDFNYNSSYWTDEEIHALEDGLEGLTEKQTKLASYWNTPFSKICLGMKVNGNTKWIVVHHKASSLFSEIADGEFRETSAGKDQWKSLIHGSNLQENCNKEGFNFQREWKNKYYLKTRIGFVANDENNCDTPDSCIGFGTSARVCGVAETTACGNLAICAGHHVNVFGFVLVL